MLSTLPYRNGFLRAFRNNAYIVIDTEFFNLQYDSIHFIKLRQCNKDVCGICGNNNGDPLDDVVNPKKFLFNNNKKGCAIN